MNRAGKLTTATLLATIGLASGCAQWRNERAEVDTIGPNIRVDAESGEVYRLYQYFPTEEVYRSVHQYTWFWKRGDQTYHGGTLPSDLSVNTDHYVLIELPTRRPFLMHTQVTAQYPTRDQLYAEADRIDAEMAIEAYATAPTDF